MAQTKEPRRKQSFPRELLVQSKEERLAYFKAYTVAHPHLSKADDAVWNAIREPAGKLIIFVFGPTGVGKTTLLEHIEKRLMEQALSRMQADQSHLPVARLNAMAPSSRLFKWADFYTRALRTAHRLQSQLPCFSSCLQRKIAAAREPSYKGRRCGAATRMGTGHQVSSDGCRSH
ncbi:MAG TPA: hypothetical protein VGF67_27700 [Ktedonobacteraceae bacterium]|jgi:hypothetical protein